MNKHVKEAKIASEWVLQSHVESNARTYARTVNFSISKGDGSLFYDDSNNRYIDCLAGAGTLATGHNHPVIIERLKQYLDSGQILHGLDMLTPIKREFTKAILEVLPYQLGERFKLQFCGPTGSDAVEASIKLFKTATGRRTVVSFHGAYHGMTAGSLALTGNLNAKSPIASLMSDVHFFPYPYSYRSPYGAQGEEMVDISLHHIRSSLSDPESGITKPAAVIVEAIQGEGGCIPAPDRWLRGLRDICTELDIPLILDEIQSGFARSGKMFAFEHAGIKPDAILLSKAVGGGLPMALMAFDGKYDKWLPGAHTGTFRGNQLGMVAGLATLDLLSDLRLVEEAARKGLLLKNELLKLKNKYSFIGDVRGRGLMVGVEIIRSPRMLDDNRNPMADGELANVIKQRCFDRGLLIESGGRSGAVLRFLPALTIEDELLLEALAILDSVMMDFYVS
jgi:diaminobutyrate-2-oxoglutarate transaminase